MLLSELIAELQKELELSGDMKCFTNGEHGAEDLVELTADTISSGLAEDELGGTDIGTGKEFVKNLRGTKVLTIGEY